MRSSAHALRPPPPLTARRRRSPPAAARPPPPAAQKVNPPELKGFMDKKLSSE
jgi:hypothetical protein